MIRTTLRGAYLKWMPKVFRKNLLLLKSDHLIKLKYDILLYYKKENNPDIEKRSVLEFLKKQSAAVVFPYEFINEYTPEKIDVFKDPENEFSYVIHKGKKLYFKKSWNEHRIKTYYISLLIEQDYRSPHTYKTNEINLKNDGTICDVGAAEGIFSLELVDKAKNLHLVEIDEEWIEALKHTFSPWMNKVAIHRKYITDHVDEFSTTIDVFFKGQQIDLLKADIEGEEVKMLEGSVEMLQAKKIKKLIICTYHKSEDFLNVKRILENNSYEIYPSNGVMIYIYDEKIGPPYFRTALIRTYK
ncbi:MAG TPA: dimethyladenosine transferase [Prolixibacteraceae bacterium]|nr:dimethyladenosine transferase [Prolixibacteraceae bacterium]